MADPFSGIQDKDLANFCRDLVSRGYEVRHMGTDHFQAFWKGEYTHCRIPLTPRSGQAFTRAKADIKRFEVAKGMWVAPKKSERPRKAKPKAPRMGKFVMPFAGDVSDKRPASIAPTQYTVATLLGVDALHALAAVVNPVKEVKTMQETRQRHEWTEEEMAATVFRYRRATQAYRDWKASGFAGDKPQTGIALLKELGVGNSHITWFTKKLAETGRYPELDAPVQPEVIPAAEVYPPQPVVVSEPVFDADEEITGLTTQWSELVSRKRELAGEYGRLTAGIDDLLTQAEELAKQRDKVTAVTAEVAAGITKVRKRLAEMVRED